MKKIFATVALSLGFAASAQATDLTQTALLVHQNLRVMEAVSPMNVINWQVGDFHKFAIDAGGFLKGNGTKKATKEDLARNAVWYVTEMSIMGQKQVVEALIDRSNGKTIELIVNGNKQDPAQGGADGELEIIEQVETSITVPAGTFECIYIKANQPGAMGQKTELQAWVNPIDVNLDGMLKTIVKQSFITLTLTLEQFGHQ